MSYAKFSAALILWITFGICRPLVLHPSFYYFCFYYFSLRLCSIAQVFLRRALLAPSTVTIACRSRSAKLWFSWSVPLDFQIMHHLTHLLCRVIQSWGSSSFLAEPSASLAPTRWHSQVHPWAWAFCDLCDCERGSTLLHSWGSIMWYHSVEAAHSRGFVRIDR